jgi:hypothetical protein
LLISLALKNLITVCLTIFENSLIYYAQLSINLLLLIK